MKKLSLLGIIFLVVGVALAVVDRNVLKSDEDRQRDDALRLAADAPTVVTLATEVRALEGDHAIAGAAGTLTARADGSNPVSIALDPIGEKPWGNSILVRTRTRNGVPESISNLYSVRPQLRVRVPDDKSWVGKLATLHLTGTVIYPTASVSSPSFSVEKNGFSQDIPVYVVASGREIARPHSVVENAGNVSLGLGFIAFAGVLGLGLVRSLGNGSQASLALADRETDIESQIKRGGRFVHFQYVISVVVMTFRRGSGVYYIPPGESRVIAGLKWTFTTFLLGWWGIPWGPIFSIGALFTNLRGGTDVTDAVLANVRQRAAQAAAAATAPPALPGAGAPS